MYKQKGPQQTTQGPLRPTFPQGALGTLTHTL